METKTINIAQIPENITLEILRYLPIKERCIAGRVCKQWRRIIADNSLWRHVDLLDYRLDLPKMWKVLRAHFSPCLLTMRVRGFAHSDSSKRKKASVSDAMLKELQNRCPNLRLLELHDCNTDSLSFEVLPQSLKALHVTSSTWQPRWLRGNSSHLPNLEDLSLAGSVRVDNFDLQDVAEWKQLKVISVSGCYRIKGSGLEAIAKNNPELESLNVSCTGVDALDIHHLCRHNKKLKKLHLSKCSGINDQCMETISLGLPDLEDVNVSYCKEVTINGLRMLCKLKGLKKLTFDKGDMSDKDHESLKSSCASNFNVEIKCL